MKPIPTTWGGLRSRFLLVVLVLALAYPVLTLVLINFAWLFALLGLVLALGPVFLVVRWWWRRSPDRGRQLLSRIAGRFRRWP